MSKLRILNWTGFGMSGSKPRREKMFKSRLFEEKKCDIFRRCSTKAVQSSSTCSVFSMASHPLRQLGSALLSIRKARRSGSCGWIGGDVGRQ